MAVDEVPGSFQSEGTLTVDQRFAVVPEWIIDAEISDCAFRLYAVLLRYGQTSRQRMPGRALLAKRLHKASKDTVDRALRELEAIGAVTVERRRAGQQNLTNRYHLRTRRPGQADERAGEQGRGGRTDAATPAAPDVADGGDREEGGRTDAATPAGGRAGAARGGRTDRGRVAALVRPDPEVLTEKNPPPTPPTAEVTTSAAVVEAAGLSEADLALLARVGVEDLPALTGRCQDLRRQLGQPTVGWTSARILASLRDAVVSKGWPAAAARSALLVVAADRTTNSPSRLGCPGPWWTQRQPGPATMALSSAEVAELDQLEVRLREADGRRVWLQQRARAELSERGTPVTRLAVARRACQLLDEVELYPC